MSVCTHTYVYIYFAQQKQYAGTIAMLPVYVIVGSRPNTCVSMCVCVSCISFWASVFCFPALIHQRHPGILLCIFGAWAFAQNCAYVSRVGPVSTRVHLADES